MWHKKLTISTAFLILVLLTNPCFAYEEFYYLDHKILEQRLVDYFKNGPDLLTNYPQSTNPQEAQKESGLLVEYGIKLTKNSLIKDMERAILEKHFYGLVMMACSIPDNEEGIAMKIILIELCEKNLSTDKYENAILAFIVKTLANKRFLMNDGLISVDRFSRILNFINEVKVKKFDTKEYKMLSKIDIRILEDCILEISR